MEKIDLNKEIYRNLDWLIDWLINWLNNMNQLDHNKVKIEREGNKIYKGEKGNKTKIAFNLS